MESLELNNVEVRPTLYFNKYRYRAKYKMMGIHAASYAKDITHFREIIQRQHRYSSSGTPYRYGITPKDYDYDTIERFMLWRSINKEKIMLRLSGDSCSVFSNDLPLLESLRYIVIKNSIEYTEIQLDGDPDVKVLKDPKHNYRIYFTNKQVNDEFKQDMLELFNAHQKTLFPCPALLKWVEDPRFNPKAGGVGAWRRKYLMPFYFIDYDDESTILLLSLFFDGYLGKKYKLEKR